VVIPPVYAQKRTYYWCVAYAAARMGHLGKILHGHLRQQPVSDRMSVTVIYSLERVEPDGQCISPLSLGISKLINYTPTYPENSF
jgi:hypothetical protein